MKIKIPKKGNILPYFKSTEKEQNAMGKKKRNIQYLTRKKME